MYFYWKKLDVTTQSVLLVTERHREISLYEDLMKLVSEKDSQKFF